VAQQGRHGVFTVTPSEISSASGTVSGTVTCSAAAAGLVSVTIAGLTGTFKAGDVIKFSGHSKVYMLTADAGNGAMAFTPPLISAVSSSDTVIYNDVPFTVRLSNDIQGYKLGAGMLYRYEVDFVEALS